MQKGKWKPYCQFFGDTKVYIAGRILDMSQPLHGGECGI